MRRKVLLAAASFDDSPNRGGEENNEKIKMKKTYERRSGGRTDVRSIEEIKAEIALVERQLREKKREEEEEEERRKKLRAMKLQSDRERDGNRRYRRCGINNSGGVDAPRTVSRGSIVKARSRHRGRWRDGCWKRWKRDGATMKTTRVRRRPHLNLGVKKITRMIFLLLRGVSSRLHRGTIRQRKKKARIKRNVTIKN